MLARITLVLEFNSTFLSFLLLPLGRLASVF